MLTLGMFQLTHPEALSEAELREILEYSCIDSGTYKNLSRLELIDLYKRVAMPLPPRRGHSESLDTKKCNGERNSINETHKNSGSLNGIRDTKHPERKTRTSESSVSLPQSPVNELRHTPKKIRLYNSSNAKQCNGTDKRVSDDKHSEAPLKKRQKITWP